MATTLSALALTATAEAPARAAPYGTARPAAIDLQHQLYEFSFHYVWAHLVRFDGKGRIGDGRFCVTTHGHTILGIWDAPGKVAGRYALGVPQGFAFKYENPLKPWKGAKQGTGEITEEEDGYRISFLYDPQDIDVDLRVWVPKRSVAPGFDVTMLKVGRQGGKKDKRKQVPILLAPTSQAPCCGPRCSAR